MEREGAVHGYGLSERIGDRTGGAWRPGPGSVYPSLQRLVANGLARRRSVGRRQVYGITPAGRRLLAEIRERRKGGGAGVPDLSPLWAEVIGATDTATFLVERLKRALGALEAEAARPGRPAVEAARLRAEVRRAVEASLAAWPSAPGAPRSALREAA